MDLGRAVKALGAAVGLILCCAASAGALSLMSWNVENLFDDVRNGTEYREFNPARGQWNTESFLLRVRVLSEVVRRAVPGGPDVLLLQEVENENALATLLDQGMKGMGYAWHVLVPKKGLSATIAIVSRLPITRVRTWTVRPWKRGSPVRDILEAQIDAGGHTLYVFNNHWKAKTEGVKATEASRKDSAAVLAGRIREIQAADPAADIVAAGDLNENVDEYAATGRRAVTALMPAEEEDGAGRESGAGDGAARADPVIFLSASAPPLDASARRCVLFEPWYEITPASRGSSSWQGEWLTADHILLSAGLFDRDGVRYRQGSFTPARLPFLLDDRGFPRKWSARGGTKGVSDHLPILLTLDVE
jgi:endonuclease/exonuclease/phosphatase family metal-dependent hydrolase